MMPNHTTIIWLCTILSFQREIFKCQWTEEAITPLLPLDLAITIYYKCFILCFTRLLNVESIHLHVILDFVIFRSWVIINGKVHRMKHKIFTSNTVKWNTLIYTPKKILEQQYVQLQLTKCWKNKAAKFSYCR